MSSIYREFILEHYKNPRNFGKIAKPNFEGKERNILCGDSMVIYGKIKNNKITDIKFQGRGCVVSKASASILTDYVKNKSVKAAAKVSIEDLIKMLGVSLSPIRTKCANLSIITLRKALDKHIKESVNYAKN